MLVCHCHAVGERAIRSAVRQGACTRLAVARECAAGGSCGGCGPLIDEIIQSELGAERAAALPALAELLPAR
jgi:bacterioferritin-associated ferredoxin